MNVFREMASSVWNFSRYPGFLKNKKGKIFGFGALLMAFYLLFVFCFPFWNFLSKYGGYAGIISRYIPDFTYENGKLEASEKYHSEADGFYVDINTDETNQVSESSPEIRSALRTYGAVLAMDSTGAVIKGWNGQTLTVPYSAVGISSLNKEGLLRMVPMLQIMTVMLFVVLYLVLLGGFFVKVFLFAVFGMLVAAVMHVSLRFRQVYCLTVYTRTLPVILTILYAYFPFYIPGFSYITSLLTFVYLAIVFRRMKSNPVVFQRNTARTMQQEAPVRPEIPEEIQAPRQPENGNLTPSDSWSFSTGNHPDENNNQERSNENNDRNGNGN